MEVKNINFMISKNGEVEASEKEFLTEAYRKLFIKIYGSDIIDALVSTTKLPPKFLLQQRIGLNKYVKNYTKSLNAIESVQVDENLELLLIYQGKDKLIGAARLRKINDLEASIPDIAIDDVSLEDSREIWKQAVEFAEKHFTNQGYEKMYVEVPLCDGPLLCRADDLGFQEDPNDVEISDAVTYLLSKELERSKYDKYGTSRK